jgi:hypothetical protein
VASGQTAGCVVCATIRKTRHGVRPTIDLATRFHRGRPGCAPRETNLTNPTLRFSGRKRRSELSHVLGRLQMNWSPTSAGAAKSIEGQPGPDGRSVRSTLRTGSAVAQASAELLFAKTHKSSGCRSTLQRRQVSPVRSDICKSSLKSGAIARLDRTSTSASVRPLR